MLKTLPVFIILCLLVVSTIPVLATEKNITPPVAINESPESPNTDEVFIELYVNYDKNGKPGIIEITVKNGDPNDFVFLHELIRTALARKFVDRFKPRIAGRGNWLYVEYLYEKDIEYNDGGKTTFVLHAGSINKLSEGEFTNQIYIELVCPEACETELIDSLLDEKRAIAPLSPKAKYHYEILKSRLR